MRGRAGSARKRRGLRRIPAGAQRPRANAELKASACAGECVWPVPERYNSRSCCGDFFFFPIFFFFLALSTFFFFFFFPPHSEPGVSPCPDWPAQLGGAELSRLQKEEKKKKERKKKKKGRPREKREGKKKEKTLSA